MSVWVDDKISFNEALKMTKPTLIILKLSKPKMKI